MPEEGPDVAERSDNFVGVDFFTFPVGGSFFGGLSLIRSEGFNTQEPAYAGELQGEVVDSFAHFSCDPPRTLLHNSRRFHQ
jgi:hypothetical protein